MSVHRQLDAAACTHIACSGAGPASLYLAILAKQAEPQRRVTVFERQREGVTLGWGVVFPDELLGALEAADPISARAVRRRAFRWQDMIVHVRGRRPVRIPSCGFSIGRRELLEILIARARELGVELIFGREIADAAQLADYDLIVAGDGVHSALREARSAAFGTASTRGGNRYIWLGTSQVFGNFIFPFVKTPAGWLWAHAYGFDDATSTFIVETSFDTWQQLGFDRLKTDATLQCLSDLFEPWLEGHTLRSQAGAKDGSAWLAFNRVTNARWHHDNVVLLGDAAHTTHFTIGSGTRLAIEDAICLAQQLQAHTTLRPALAAYARERSAALRGAQLEARYSARWFESVPRYIGADDQEFADLLDARRSTLMPYLPPRMFLKAKRAARRIPFLTQPVLRTWRALQRRLQSSAS